METLQIRKKDLKTWWHIPSDQKEYAISKLSCKFNGEWFRVVEQGGRQRGKYHYSQITIYDDTQGGTAETFSSPIALFLRLEALKYVGFEWGSGGGGVGFQPQIVAPQDGQVIIYDDGVWQNGFLDLQGNRFIQTQDIPPIEDNILTVPFGFVWIINTITYSNLTDWTDTIPFTSSEEMVRTDIIVAIASNTFVRIQGEENDGFPIQPTLPPNSLLVTSIDVYHDSFGEPSIPVLGEQYIAKISEQWFYSQNTGNVIVALPVIINGNRRKIRFQANIGMGTFHIGRLDYGTVGGTPIASIWGGMDVTFQNVGLNDITIKHFDTSLPVLPNTYRILCPQNQDVILKTGESITLSYDNYSGYFNTVSIAKLNEGGGGSTSADQVSYDNTDSGLDATNVQDAIDELSERPVLTNDDNTLIIDENIIRLNVTNVTEEFTANGTDRNFEMTNVYASIENIFINGVRINSSDYTTISEQEIEIEETVTLLSGDVVVIQGTMFIIP